ncbi:MAG: type II toxin-antitoxin system RelE/ParE family toxin [Candidatus Cloacimonetes bacterium]|nr:type II toxin-antitoxin system RelE/ParE family toxin [Candidatus Cloacimonadota bacterium]
MEIRFKNKRFAGVLNDYNKSIASFGKAVGKTVHLRLQQMRAINNLNEMNITPGIRCHPLKGKKTGEYGITLTGNYRLIIKPDYEVIPRKKDGGIDLTKIEKVLVLNVEDYHG